MSFPNQKIYRIKKPSPPNSPFLQISQSDWQEAAASLTRTAFIIYLYFAQNQDNYLLDFSPTAITQTGLMSKGAATKARYELEEKGYLQDGIFYVESKRKRELKSEPFNSP